MAKSEARIRMDYMRAKECAAHLEYTARLIQQNVNHSLAPTMTAIGSVWKGGGSDIFTDKGRKLQRQIMDQAKELDYTAQMIQAIAINTYTAEMKARRIIEQKSRR
ncbi:MAG TPA: hypothetical protein DF613_09730 [Lachnospiraceae bacterium]|nr:hypothetical protein [Lachnospiraceae bacterium]